MENGCKGCARLVRIVNNGTMFCTTREGVLYYVDPDWYDDNPCEGKEDRFCLSKLALKEGLKEGLQSAT